MVVSGDRDVYQLVGDGVRVMTTSRGVTDTKIYDREGVVERYGVPPELVPDLIGLKGDTSDNIPGVPGIGDKTAAQLLQQFGSLEAVLDSVDEISGRQAQAEPDRARRRRPHLEAAGDAELRHRRPDRRQQGGADHAGSQPPARGGGGVRAARGDAAPRRGVGRGRPRPRRRGDAGGRGGARGLRPTCRRARSRSPSRAGRWAGTDGDRVVAGDAPDLVALAERLRGHPLIAHDAKSLGGGGADGPAGGRAARTASTSPTTRWSPPT